MKLLILALATWRLSSLIVSEEGPFRVFSKFREIVGVRHAPDGEPFGTNWFAMGISCIWCCTVWIGLALAVSYWLWKPTVWIALPFALSAGAIIVEEFVG